MPLRDKCCQTDHHHHGCCEPGMVLCDASAVLHVSFIKSLQKLLWECECISWVSALGIKNLWILFGNAGFFLYPWIVTLKSFREENILVPACGVILGPPHGCCMKWAEEVKSVYKTSNHFVSKKCSVRSFFCKIVFLAIKFAFVVYIFTLSSLVNSGEIENLSFRGEKPHLEQLFTFHAWVMWKMPSVEIVMNILKVQPTC